MHSTFPDPQSDVRSVADMREALAQQATVIRQLSVAVQRLQDMDVAKSQPLTMKEFGGVKILSLDMSLLTEATANAPDTDWLVITPDPFTDDEIDDWDPDGVSDDQPNVLRISAFEEALSVTLVYGYANATLDSTEDLQEGMSVTGDGVAPGSTITAIIDDTTIQLSVAALVSGSVQLTFSVDDVTITGLVWDGGSYPLVLWNVGGPTILLTSDDDSSEAANQFHFQNGLNVTLEQDGWAWLLYDPVSGYWRMLQGQTNCVPLLWVSNVCPLPGSTTSFQVEYTLRDSCSGDVLATFCITNPTSCCPGGSGSGSGPMSGSGSGPVCVVRPVTAGYAYPTELSCCVTLVIQGTGSADCLSGVYQLGYDVGWTGYFVASSWATTIYGSYLTLCGVSNATIVLTLSSSGTWLLTLLQGPSPTFTNLYEAVGYQSVGHFGGLPFTTLILNAPFSPGTIQASVTDYACSASIYTTAPQPIPSGSGPISGVPSGGVPVACCPGATIPGALYLCVTNDSNCSCAAGQYELTYFGDTGTWVWNGTMCGQSMNWTLQCFSADGTSYWKLTWTYNGVSASQEMVLDSCDPLSLSLSSPLAAPSFCLTGEVGVTIQTTLCPDTSIGDAGLTGTLAGGGAGTVSQAGGGAAGITGALAGGGAGTVTAGGPPNVCMTLNGSNQYATGSDADLPNTSTGITISLWFKAASGATNGQVMFGYGLSGSSYVYINLGETVGGQYEVIGHLQARSVASSPGSIVTGTWYNLILIGNSSGSTVTLYLNGTSVASTSNTWSVAPDGGFWLGQEGGFGSYFDGELYDVRVYNSDQTANVSAIYNGGTPSYTDASNPASNTVGWWKCTEGSGNTAADSSASAKNATLSGNVSNNMWAADSP